ncbi:hypothetical protein [uncultured Tateyamaria sp.]|uniref:hypothetical protein n=1 Tax=uncultured Tateyamaria sp. TaxID=455651 RepID=UPI002616591A|nr:hypothetical protein [uncultured Tateyamaria sp.]
MRKSKWIVVAGLVGACAPQNLYVAHDTVVGVNAKVSADRQQGQLVVGYDRDFVTIVPTSVEAANGDRDAMALISCTDLEVQSIYLSKYTDITISGAAATAFGEQLNSGSDVFDCNAIGQAGE